MYLSFIGVSTPKWCSLARLRVDRLMAHRCTYGRSEFKFDHKPCYVLNNFPAMDVVSRVQIPHPAPPFVPQEICFLQRFSHKLDFLLRFLFSVLSGLSFIHILDLNGLFTENILTEVAFQVT